MLVHLAGESAFVFHAQIHAHLLQLALLVAVAGEALLVMVAQQQLQVHPPGVTELRGVRLHIHPGGNGQHAGRAESPGSGVHHAHAAGTDLVDILQIAQRRNIDTGLLRGFQNRRAGGNFNADTVNRQLYEIFHALFPPCAISP